MSTSANETLLIRPIVDHRGVELVRRAEGARAGALAMPLEPGTTLGPSRSS